jgi:DNA-binding transcriptional regulator PaaX
VRRLLKQRPDIAKRIGMDPDAVKPSVEKVLASPAITRRLDKLRQMRMDGANPADVKAIVDELWRVAGQSEYGPAVMDEARAIIEGQLSKEMWRDEDERTITSLVNGWWNQ